MYRYKDIIIKIIERLDHLQLEHEDGRDYFLMQLGMEELLRACGYVLRIEPEGYILEKTEA